MEIIDSLEFTACIGGGNFGTKATLLSKEQDAVTLVIDPYPECKASRFADIKVRDLDEVDFDLRGKVQYLQADGCDIIMDVFKRRCPDILVPAAPGHLMAKAAVKTLSKQGITAWPYTKAIDEMYERLENDIILITDREGGVIVASYMEEGKLCLERCPQPEVCPVTGRVKELPMYMVLERAMEGTCTRSFILHSLLLNDKGGVGGVIGKDVKEFLEAVATLHKGESFSVATSCSCHGVVNALLLDSVKR